MKDIYTPLLTLGVASGLLVAAAVGNDNENDSKISFKDPVRLKAGGEYVKTEAPGYAAPCWTDVNRDGRGDLVVGQFSGGKMKLYLGSEAGLSTGQWLKADGKVAEVPGVW